MQQLEQPPQQPRDGALRAVLRRARRQRGVLAAAAAVAVIAAIYAEVSVLAVFFGWLAVAVAALYPGGERLAFRAASRQGGLARSSAQLSEGIVALASSLPDPCFLLRLDGRVLAQNDAAHRHFGAVASGGSIYTLLRAPDIGDAVAEAGRTHRSVRVEYLERVPVDRWFEAHAVPVFDRGPAEAKRHIATALLLHDLSQQKRVEQMRADFVANASHELRTPLASLSSFIETLQGPARDDTEARERFLEIMRNQAVRMSHLIDDLLSLSRIELNAHIRPDDHVDLANVIAHVIEALSPLADNAGVELNLTTASGELVVRGDRDELVQVFQNLIDNAIKYGAAGKRVEVTLTREPRSNRADEIIAEVRDYGPGIPEEHVPRLTERFYRVDVASSREKGGTGLGLAIVKHILNRHHAGLTIANADGPGALFTVRLNAATDSPPESATDPGEAPGETKDA
jgi:two-component system phosphate regulon sensor histidine kinase PhoR